MNLEILFRNFHIFSSSKESLKNFQSLIFNLAISGKLDFRKISQGRIKKDLKSLIEEQKKNLEKEKIKFEIKSNESLWPMVKLGDVCEIRSGGTPKRSMKKYWNGKIPWVGSTVCKDTEVKEAKEFITIEGLNNSSAKIFKKDSTLIALVGATIGRTGFLKFECATNQNIAGLYPKNTSDLNTAYLFNIAKKLYPGFLELGQRKFKMANLSFIKNQKIPIPPLEVQEEIVTLMEKYEVISLESKKQQELQSQLSKSSTHFMKKAKTKKELFNGWSIVKNNLEDILSFENGRKDFQSLIFDLTIGGKLDFKKISQERIKKDLKSLIEEQKKNLEKEKIKFEIKANENPWPMVKLGDVCDFVRGPFGGSLKKAIFISHGYPVYEQSHAIYSDFSKFRYFIDQKKFKEMKRFEVKPQDIIMSCSGTIGKTSIIPQNAKIGIINQALLKLTSRSNLSVDFLKLIMDSSFFKNKLTSHGGVIKNVSSAKILKQIKIPLPPLSIQKEIVTLVEKYEVISLESKKQQELQSQLSKSLSYNNN